MFLQDGVLARHRHKIDYILRLKCESRAASTKTSLSRRSIRKFSRGDEHNSSA